jgi:hypothetical protein
MANRNKTTRLTEAHVDAQLAAIKEYDDALQHETLRCENSTAEAICGAQNAQKLSELYSGLEVWKKALCTSATRYYKTCFELARRNMDDLSGKKPADFAYERAATGLSLFLRVSALDEEEESLDGRVRKFIRMFVAIGRTSGVIPWRYSATPHQPRSNYHGGRFRAGSVPG